MGGPAGGPAAARSGSNQDGGATTQPMPRAGESVLETDPSSTTRDRSAPCMVPTGRRS